MGADGIKSGLSAEVSQLCHLKPLYTSSRDSPNYLRNTPRTSSEKERSNSNRAVRAVQAPEPNMDLKMQW